MVFISHEKTRSQFYSSNILSSLIFYSRAKSFPKKCAFDTVKASIFVWLISRALNNVTVYCKFPLWTYRSMRICKISWILNASSIFTNTLLMETSAHLLIAKYRSGRLMPDSYISLKIQVWELGYWLFHFVWIQRKNKCKKSHCCREQIINFFLSNKYLFKKIFQLSEKK